MPEIYSRNDIGLRPPRRISNNYDYSRGGAALHYGGSSPNPAPTDLDRIFAIWRSWQNFHIDSRGWNDIAYNFGIGDNGAILTGRGLNARCGANGTNAANENFAAICWIGGGSVPSQAAIDSFVYLVDHLRDEGIGLQVRPHKYFFSTGCPGDKLTSLAGSLNGKVISQVPSGSTGGGTLMPKPGKIVGPRYKFPLPNSNYYFGIDDGTKYSVSGKYKRLISGHWDYWWIIKMGEQLQRRGWDVGKGRKWLGGSGNNGIYGPEYRALIKTFQGVVGIRQDGRAGPVTWDHLFNKPIV